MRLFIIGTVFFLSTGTLVTLGIISSGTPVLKVSDLFAADFKIQTGNTIRVDNGVIVSIESTTPVLRFHYATEEDPARSISVETNRNPPDNFRIGINASIRGTYDPENNLFKANQVTTNCPSRYSPEEEYKQDQRQKGAGGSPGYKEPVPGTSMGAPVHKNTVALGVMVR